MRSTGDTQSGTGDTQVVTRSFGQIHILISLYKGLIPVDYVLKSGGAHPCYRFVKWYALTR